MWAVRLGVGAMVFFVFQQLLYGGFNRLVFGAPPSGAIDLHFRWLEVRQWFSGLPVYGVLRQAIYPPATYPLLWPVVGWVDFGVARWIWGLSSIVMLAWGAALLVRESGARDRYAWWLIALMLPTLNASSVTVGNGQLILHILPLLLLASYRVLPPAGVTPGEAAGRSLGADVATGAMLCVAMVKPTIAVPFLWLLFLVPGGRRPVLAAAGWYLLLTIFAGAFQAPSLEVLIRQWLAAGTPQVNHGGYGDLHDWLGSAHLDRWMLPASFALLVLHGAWVWRHRQGGRWLLLAVTAIVARVWSYHRMYDDVLIVLPLLALFRYAVGRDRAAIAAQWVAMLFGVTLVSLWLPGRWSFEPEPWKFYAFQVWHVTMWALVLAFLLWQAEWEKRTDRRTSAALT